MLINTYETDKLIRSGLVQSLFKDKLFDLDSHQR